MKPPKRGLKDPNQPDLFAVIWKIPKRPYRLRAGDVLRIGGKLCRVVRVNECAAVVVMNQKPRTFETRFRGPVTFQPSPAMFRISADSEGEILNLRPGEPR